MNDSDALELITYTRAKWGAAAAVPTDKRLLGVVVLAWMDALADIDPRAVRAVLADADDEFPPTPKVIRNRVEKLSAGQDELPAWDEFWSWVRSLASNCSQFSAERGVHRRESVDCPWPAMVGLITPGLVSGWASEGLKEADLDMVIQAHVRRQFESRVTRVQRDGITDVPALAAWKVEAAKAIGHPGELEGAA